MGAASSPEPEIPGADHHQDLAPGGTDAIEGDASVPVCFTCKHPHARDLAHAQELIRNGGTCVCAGCCDWVIPALVGDWELTVVETIRDLGDFRVTCGLPPLAGPWKEIAELYGEVM